MTSDRWHKRKGKWPETRGDLPFKIKHEIHKTKKPRQDIPHHGVTDASNIMCLMLHGTMCPFVGLHFFQMMSFQTRDVYDLWTMRLTAVTLASQHQSIITSAVKQLKYLITINRINVIVHSQLITHLYLL